MSIIVSCKSYLHVDMRETASHAGNLLEQALNMGKSIKTTMRQPPHMGGLDGRRTDVERMTKLISKLKAMEEAFGQSVILPR